MDKYLIAGHVIALACNCREACDAFQNFRYAGDREPERVFCVDAEELREKCEEWTRASLPDMESYLLNMRFCSWLASHDGMYLHASVVAYEGCAYAFTADPGTGKSTHARLWKQAFGDAVEILNDDKPLLMLSSGQFFVCASPWCGKEEIRSMRTVPLKGICFLSQGKTNEISSVSAKDAVVPLLRQTLLLSDREEMDRLLTLIERLTAAVPMVRLRCNISEDAARMARAAMHAEQRG